MTKESIFKEKAPFKPIRPKTANAKAAGLKSTFEIEGEVLMTSFGRGNDAVVEKSITGNEVKELNPSSKLKVTPDICCYNVSGNGKTTKAYSTNPDSTKNVGEDLIGAKDVLEKRYFGRTFNDNIHIQLIYNILDIEKILTIYINDIVYALDNLSRGDEFEVDDLIGYMGAQNSYETFRSSEKTAELYEKFCEFCRNKRLYYYDCIPLNEEGGINKRYLYYILSVLGEIRQFCAHSKDIDALYTLEKVICSEAKQVIDGLYKEKIDKINSSFVNNSAKNMTVLYEALGITDATKKKNLAKRYYLFAIKKEFKNIGFSIKKLREKIAECCDKDVSDEKFDTVRGKLYTLLDFVIFNYYRENSAFAEENVAALRLIASDEEQKEDFYKKEATRLWVEINSTWNKIKEKMGDFKNNSIVVSAEEKSILKEAVARIAISENANIFSKVIYLMTLFLDGKEINILLTTLINKFENIASFAGVINERKIPGEFRENRDYNFAIFERSRARAVAGELRVINSFARMTKPSKNAKLPMYMEAAKLLGVTDSDDKLEAYLEENMLGEHIKKGSHDFRNFIANNVINSSRFKYLVRYANPEKVRVAAQNKAVVKFVLGKMDDNLINRYYGSCFDNECPDRDVKVERLTDIINKMSFESLSSVKMDTEVATEKEKRFKAQKQAVVSLYLTVLFILVKNLVNVNSRYFLANHCLERDARLLLGKPGVDGIKINRCMLTEKHIADERQKVTEWYNSLAEEKRSGNRAKRKWRIERACDYLEEDIKNIDNDTLTLYRNNIAHLNPVRNIDSFVEDVREFNSYFELYHYLMQRSIEKTAEHFGVRLSHPKVIEYLSEMKKRGTYCKDFVKALNSPFGYNLPRFKNLSVDALFDMHTTPYAQTRKKTEE